MTDFFETIIELFVEDVPTLLWQHIYITLISLSCACAVAVPLGVFLTRKSIKRYSGAVLAVLNVAQSVPSLAILALGMRFMGVGLFPSLVVLTIYGLLPIVRNTIAGINKVDEDILEASRGMGLSKTQTLFRVELPLAMPIILNGIQTTAVILVATTAVAALIGAGGLGTMIFIGVTMMRSEQIIVGAGLTTLMAIILDKGIGYISKKSAKSMHIGL